MMHMYVFDSFLCALQESLCEQAQDVAASSGQMSQFCLILFCLCHLLTLVSDLKSIIYFFFPSLCVFFGFF